MDANAISSQRMPPLTILETTAGGIFTNSVIFSQGFVGFHLVTRSASTFAANSSSFHRICHQLVDFSFIALLLCPIFIDFIHLSISFVTFSLNLVEFFQKNFFQKKKKTNRTPIANWPVEFQVKMSFNSIQIGSNLMHFH